MTSDYFGGIFAMIAINAALTLMNVRLVRKSRDFGDESKQLVRTIGSAVMTASVVLSVATVALVVLEVMASRGA